MAARMILSDSSASKKLQERVEDSTNFSNLVGSPPVAAYGIELVKKINAVSHRH